jgi:hypothetical protein
MQVYRLKLDAEIFTKARGLIEHTKKLILPYIASYKAFIVYSEIAAKL